MTLSDLKPLASMQYYNSLSGDVPWGTVAYLNYSIDDPIIWFGDHPVVIPEPGSALLPALGAPAVLVVARSRRARRRA